MSTYISHVAVWSKDIERLKDFYCTYFKAISNTRYYNPVKRFSSYFLTFEDGSCGLELMSIPDLKAIEGELSNNHIGLVHLAFSVGSKENVDKITTMFRGKGYTVHSDPRYTGDGFYESAILDPDGNIIEITV